MSLADHDIDSRLGARIRDLRTGRDLTLEGLARLADVSRAMLSRVERGESSPTAQLLARICGGLGITMSALFAVPEPRAGPVSRRADQPVWRDPDTRYTRRSVVPPGAGATVDITDIELPAGARVAFDNQRLAGVIQHVWVLDGRLEVGSGDDAFSLEAGDCLTMRLDRPVTFRNPTARAARYAVIISRGGP